MDGSLIRDIQFAAKMPLGEGSAYEEHAILVGCNFDVVHLLGKSLHYLDEENNPKQAKSENNRLELRSDILITLDNEIKRWQDILSVDYNKWLFDD